MVDTGFKIFGPPTVSKRDLAEWAFAHGAADEQDQRYLSALHDYAVEAGIDPAMAAAQWADEASSPDGRRLGDSTYWTRDGNPAGIGIWQPGVPSPWSGKLTPEQSAAVHVLEILAHTSGIPDGIANRPWAREAARIDGSHLASLTSLRTVRSWPKPAAWTIGHLSQPIGGGDYVWAANQNYGHQIASQIDRMYRYRKDTSMAIVARQCPIHLDVVTKPMVNRPAIPMPDASFVTVHETGNQSPGATARMHRDFVHNGGGEHAVSFHFVIDENEAFQLIYLNENAWHASDGYTGRGNRDSIAIETCQIGNQDRVRSNLAWLIAEIYRNPARFLFRSDVGQTDDLDPAKCNERTKRHYDWAPDKKWCPQFILSGGLWAPLMAAVTAELAEAVPSGPKYSPAVLPDWWSEIAVLDLRSHREDGVLYQPQGLRMVALKETGAYADPLHNTSLRTRSNIKKGEAVDIRYRYKKGEDMIGITRHGTHVYLKYFDPTVTYRYKAREQAQG